MNLSHVVGGILKYQIVEKRIGSRNGGAIRPVAQPDVIMTFCKSVSASLIEVIPTTFSEIINKKIESYPGKEKKEVEQHFQDCSTLFNQEMNKITQKEVSNTLRIVDSLPLPEMAFLAENLVNMTALKRMYVIDGNQQTVGGPIDVAIMSKGDGFTWIKKKEIAGIFRNKQ